MYTGKRKRGDVVGVFKYAGEEVDRGEIFLSEDWEGDVKSGIAWGKCLLAATCSFEGMCEKTKDWLCYTAKDNPYDLYASTMSGPKWHPISVLWERKKYGKSAVKFVETSFIPNKYIRHFCREFVPERYLSYYDGSYVNSGTNLDGYIEGLSKLEGYPNSSGKILECDKMTDFEFFNTYVSVLDSLDYFRSSIPFCANKEVATFNYSRSNAGYGFDAYRFDSYGTKGQYKELHRSHVHWIHYRCFTATHSWEDELPIPGFVFATKLEVRGPEVDPNKVRYTQTNNMMTDYMYELQLRPIYTWCKSLPIYLGGVSVRHNQISKILRALRHPLARMYYPDCPIYTGPCALGSTDLGRQDTTFNSRNKMAFYMIICSMFRREEGTLLQSKIDKLFAYNAAWGNLNLVQFWGDNWYFVDGTNPTGHKFTAVLAFLMGLWNHHAGLITWRPNDYKEIHKWLWTVFFGDDQSIRCPVPVARSVYGLNYHKYAAHCREYLGINIKPDESFLLYPTANHKDRMFAFVVDDILVSPGLVMLKRYIVKLDANCNIVHPDSEDFACLSLWRRTEDYVARFALDPENWSAEGNYVWIKWFQKQFGLIIDAGANRTAHNMIKDAVLSAKSLYPDLFDTAAAGFSATTEYLEHVKKFGQIPDGLMYQIFDLPNSFKLVCSLYIPWKGEVHKLEERTFNRPSAWDLPR